jgi:hypothetical protein
LITVTILLLGGSVAYTQNVDVEKVMNFKDKKWFKLNGGISINGTYYDASEMHDRQPFTYHLNGNLNISILGLLDIPLSFNLNNFGTQYSYPSLPNRLSLHPSYKWIRAHIGDVSMVFSPYTLNGHMFTGGGIELVPGKWSIAAMGGRLLREVAYDPGVPAIPPTYPRWGTGLKVRRDGGNYFAGVSFFTAKDRYKETSFYADSLGIFPKSNVAVGLEGGATIFPDLRLSAEYAFSSLHGDTRPVLASDAGEQVSRRGEAPTFYHAVKATLDYTFFKNTIGLGYERIDPGYETLGGYYFNNDYENFTLNYARPLFNDKMSVALSGGVQRDDLDGSKQDRNTRIVGSANVTYSPGERLNMSLSASTFQGYRVIKSQFDYINQTTPYENLDTLNFTQISQNLDFSLSWMIQQDKTLSQNIVFFAGYQEAADRQGRYILPGNLSRFINASAVYGLDLTPVNTNFTLGINVSNNYSNQRSFLTLGPTFAMNMKLFDSKALTGVSLSFNRSYDQSVPTADVFNCRWNGTIQLFKSHSLQSSAIFQQQRRMKQIPVKKTRSFTGQLGYMYNF